MFPSTLLPDTDYSSLFHSVSNSIPIFSIPITLFKRKLMFFSRKFTDFFYLWNLLFIFKAYPKISATRSCVINAVVAQRFIKISLKA